jgi:hypothetical protein
MTTLLGLLCGALLGTRYKVFCLPPAILAGMLAVAVLDRVHHAPLGSTALSALAIGVALQIGYLAGAMIRTILLSSPATTVSAACLHDRSAGLS